MGEIDVWVNDAMATVFSPFKEVSPEEYRRATEVTYLGYVYGTMAALKRMLPRDRGTIVQVGSALSYRGIPLQAAYCGAKFAIRGFTDSVRTELMHEGSNVHLTMVQLPALNTPQFDVGRTHLPRHPQPVPPIFQPEVAADAIYWAAHHKRREVYVGTPTVATILGNKAAPWLRTATSRARATALSRRIDPSPRTAPTTSISPSGATTELAAPLTRRRTGGARSSGRRSTVASSSPSPGLASRARR